MLDNRRVSAIQKRIITWASQIEEWDGAEEIRKNFVEELEKLQSLLFQLTTKGNIEPSATQIYILDNLRRVESLAEDLRLTDQSWSQLCRVSTTS
jgi:hypothetical protein